jgi:IS30 family transposase
MIPPETRAAIRRYFHAGHWKISTIARELNVHPDAVRNAHRERAAQKYAAASGVRRRSLR